MTSNWATEERERIGKQILNNTGQNGQPSAFQEYVISLLSPLMQGSLHPDHSTLEQLAQQISTSGQSRADAWNDFLSLIYSAAMSTSSDSIYRHLVDFVFALAKFDELKSVSSSTSDDPEVECIFNMQEFGWMARELWNGPVNFIHAYGSREAAQRAWVNLNRFMAHMSVQQRLTPTDSFKDWLEDFGLWTISDGLETRSGTVVKEHGEPAAAWLLVAGSDIHGDQTWGRRNGIPSPGIPLRQGELWDEKFEQGATQDTRWGFWKERLGDIAGGGEVDAQVSEIMRLAKEAMDRVR